MNRLTMPGALCAFVTLSAVIAGVNSGCATAVQVSSNSLAEGAPYLESATDIINRAPKMMSVPAEVADNSRLDQMSLRTQADFHFTIGESYSLESDTQRAIEEYKLTLIYDPKSVRVRMRLAAEYLKQGLVTEAMEQAKSALEIEPKNEDAHLLLGGLYSAVHVYESALKEYRTVVELNPQGLEAPMFIAALQAEQKKYSLSISQFEKLAKTPGNANAHLAWFYFGRVNLEENKSGSKQKAEMAFQRALALRPNHVDSLLALGEIYESSGRRAQTISNYRQFQERHGPNATVAEELARLYLENKDYARAFEQLVVVETNDPDDLNPKVKMAFILIEQQKYPEAIIRLEDILSRAPNSDKVRFYLGAVYEEVKDYKSAIGQFSKVPNMSTYYNEAVVHSAYLYKVLGDSPNAVRVIEAGIATQPDQPQFYSFYAVLLDDLKRYDSAFALLNGAVERFPENAQLRFFLGNIQDKLGKKDETIKSMKSVLEIDKDHIQALNYLAYTYAESGQHLQEAEQMARHALALQPNDAYIMDTLGWVLFRKGAVSDAIRTLEVAYQIQPEESVIAEHLADAYYHQQLPEKAKKLYMRAAEKETNVVTIEKIRAKILDVDRQIHDIHSLGSSSSSAGARVPASEH